MKNPNRRHDNDRAELRNLNQDGPTKRKPKSERGVHEMGSSSTNNPRMGAGSSATGRETPRQITADVDSEFGSATNGQITITLRGKALSSAAICSGIAGVPLSQFIAIFVEELTEDLNEVCFDTNSRRLSDICEFYLDYKNPRDRARAMSNIGNMQAVRRQEYIAQKISASKLFWTSKDGNTELYVDEDEKYFSYNIKERELDNRDHYWAIGLVADDVTPKN